jgi:broad specificity phosphatase PhoE
MRIRFSVFVVLALVTFAPVAQAQRAVLLVRHAEPQPDPGNDPSLSRAGEERAERLASLLKDVGITAIYTSEFRRTVQTAQPLARALSIMSASVPARDREGLFTRIQRNNPGDVVLIVGHAMTVPALLKLFGHSEDVTIAADEFDNLFIVVPRANSLPTVLRLRY